MRLRDAENIAPVWISENYDARGGVAVQIPSDSFHNSFTMDHSASDLFEVRPLKIKGNLVDAPGLEPGTPCM